MAANQKSRAMRHVPYFFSTCQPNAMNSSRFESRWPKLSCTKTELTHLKVARRPEDAARYVHTGAGIRGMRHKSCVAEPSHMRVHASDVSRELITKVHY